MTNPEIKSALTGLLNVSVSQMIENGQLDCYLEMRLSNLADPTMFIIQRAMFGNIFKRIVSQFFKMTVHNQVEDVTVHIGFQTPYANCTLAARRNRLRYRHRHNNH